MRKAFFSALFITCSMLVQSQVKFDNFSFSPKFPKGGDKLSFEFNAGASSLSDEKNIDIAIYLFTSKELKVLEPSTSQNGKIYTGSILLDSNTQCIAIGLSADDKKENNFGKGFIIPMYDKANVQTLESYIFMGQLYSGYGEYLFGMANEPAKNLSTLDEAIKVYPAAMETEGFAGAYLYALNVVKKKESEPFILQQLKAMEAKPVLKESTYDFLTQWYNRLKLKATADSLVVLMKKQYPDGRWKKSESLNAINTEKDIVKKQQLLEEYIAANPPKEEDKFMIHNIQSQIANTYATNKNFKAFTEITDKLDPAMRYSLYNNIAWGLAEANENIAEATKMAKEATEWTKTQVSNPTEKKPDQLTNKAWEQKRKNDYALYADTYAYILYNTGLYKEGLPFAKDAATINKLQDAELNERYALLLEKAAPVAEAKQLIEQMVSAGNATEKVKGALKNIYVAEKKNDAGFDAYLAGLEAAAKAKKKEGTLQSMINQPAPKFTLKDFAGKDVSLESLKGKVVVVDFWATWCGPCIASMPGMKTAEEQLKARGDVVFLFVDTWENVENKKKNAMDFMKKKNYPFYVLMDDDNKVVTDFGVSGIPTKFIIDKTGNIRFKAVGFSGNASELVDEITTMVELASK